MKNPKKAIEMKIPNNRPLTDQEMADFFRVDIDVVRKWNNYLAQDRVEEAVCDTET